MLRFFLKVFLLSFTAIAFSWFVEGAFYTYYYSRSGGEGLASQFVLPRPAAVDALVKDTNVLLLGVAGKSYPAPYLTDTIILAMVKASPASVTLVSIPRDLIVKVPGGKNVVKINSLYELGKTYSPLEPEKFIKEKTEKITGIPLDYYAVIDVVGLEKVIDSLGGLDIDVKKPIADPFFPGPHYSYEPFYLEAGLSHLNGHDAVRFARTRYSKRGDFDRMERQHQLLTAIREKIGQHSPLPNNVVTLFNELKNHFVSNANLQDLPVFLATALDVKGSAVQSFSLDTSREQGLLISDRLPSGAYAIMPKAGLENYKDIQAFFTKLNSNP